MVKFSKKGSSALGGTAMRVVYGFLGIVLLLLLAKELITPTMEAIGNIGAISNLPLAGLFGAGGVITMIIVVVIIVATIKNAGSISK